MNHRRSDRRVAEIPVGDHSPRLHRPLKESQALSVDKVSTSVVEPAPTNAAAGLVAFATRFEGVGLRLLSTVVLIIVWYFGSLMLPTNILPSPLTTVEILIQNFSKGLIAEHFYATMTRVVFGFAFAMVLGVAVGTLMGLSTKFEKLLDIWIMVGLTVPSLVYVIISFMWFGLNEFATIFAIATTTFPSIAINVWEGVKNVDSKLADMAKVFNASKQKRVLEVILPQLLPYIMAATRFGFGIIWKVTVLVELLGRNTGVGYMLNYWFQLYNMGQVLAWTLFFTIIMLFVELVFLKQLENWLFAWRPAVRV